MARSCNFVSDFSPLLAAYLGAYKLANIAMYSDSLSADSCVYGTRTVLNYQTSPVLSLPVRLDTAVQGANVFMQLSSGSSASRAMPEFSFPVFPGQMKRGNTVG